MTTAHSIINQAARKIGVVGRGFSMSADEAQDFLAGLNSLVGLINADSSAIYNFTSETFPTTGASSYTMGPSGDFNTTRPAAILSVYVTSGTSDYALERIGDAEYNALTSKDIGGIPSYYTFNGNYPLSTIKFYPAPSSSNTVTIVSRKPLSSFSDLFTEYQFPDGVETMLVHTLAVHMAPEYEKEASPTVKSIAAQSLLAVKTANIRNNPPISSTGDIPGSSGARFDIYAGEYI